MKYKVKEIVKNVSDLDRQLFETKLEDYNERNTKLVWDFILLEYLELDKIVDLDTDDLKEVYIYEIVSGGELEGAEARQSTYTKYSFEKVIS